MFDLFAALPAACRNSFLSLPHWYQYLDLDNKCQVKNFTVPGDLILVVLALVDILIHIAGLVAVIFVIYGGVQYVTSQGNPDATAKAQSTIINALVALALVAVAIATVSFIGNRLS
jgi:hypothetical protein